MMCHLAGVALVVRTHRRRSPVPSHEKFSKATAALYVRISCVRRAKEFLYIHSTWPTIFEL